MSNIGVINVSVSSHYRDSSNTSDVTTQGLLGEQVEVLETGATHIHIRQKDGYQSWIPDDQIAPLVEMDGQDILVRSHFMRLYSQPAESSDAVRDAVIGCRLKAVGEQDGWYRIALPDGTFGWAEKNHFKAMPAFSPESIISLAHEFLGYQYFWGGVTPKGFDCSGFVQTVFGLHGVQMPRDTWQQQQHHQISTNLLDAHPGDLLYFSSKPDQVTHVAIALGQQKYIHASGWIKINSFNKDDADYLEKWVDNFTSVNRYR